MSWKPFLPFLVVSLLVAGASVSVTHAGPGITNYNAWPNEVGPSSYHRSTQTKSDRLRARATQQRARPVQTAPALDSSRPRCRFLGGPRASPIIC